MKGKTVVATGATSGIGEAAVLALAQLGARIVFVARDERRAEATLNEARDPRPAPWPRRASGRPLEHGGDAARGTGDRQRASRASTS